MEDRSPTSRKSSANVPPSLRGKGDRGLGPVVRGQYVAPARIERAKQLRREMTPEEEIIWQRVRRNGLVGLHFRRQKIIDGYIVDFYCHAAGLVVELDGGIHAERYDYDQDRDLLLAARGLEVLRIPNDEVRRDLDGVLERIARVARTRI